MSVARRTLGQDQYVTLSIRSLYAQSLYDDPAATRDDVREAVTKFEEIERTARRVLGGAHPLTTAIENHLHEARAELRAREDSV